MAEEAILTKHNGEVKMSKEFDYLCSKLRNGRYKLSIVRCSEKRTINQNDLMWMWFKCIEDETGTPKNDIYLYYCKKFLSRLALVNGEEVMIYDTSSKLNTKQMSDFMTKIQVDAVMELGINLPQPIDRFYESFVGEYGRR